MSDALNLIENLQKSVDRIEQTTYQIKEQQAVHNHILNEHHARSTTLENELKPIKEDWLFRLRLTRLAFGGLGLISIISIIVSVLIALGRFF